MSRSVEEWIGKDDDATIPPRVRVRVFDRCGGKCGQCGRKIRAGEKWTCEHMIAIINGGKNRESNLGVTCSWCLPDKNAADVAEKSRVYMKRAKHIGVALKTGPKIKSAGFPKRCIGCGSSWARLPSPYCSRCDEKRDFADV